MTDERWAELLEKLADAEHASWARWMGYLFMVCPRNPDGSYTIPVERADRWRRQVALPYHLLTEEEKDSDRAEVRRILPAIEEAFAPLLPRRDDDHHQD